MSNNPPTRDEAFALLKEFNTSDSLINHALAVEATMRYMARKHGEDEDKWGLVGLIHDIDYEQYPEQHCQRSAGSLRRAAGREDTSAQRNPMVGESVPMWNPNH